MANEENEKIGMAHAVDKYVGARVRERRKALRLSQSELAQKIDLTFQQVQKYERGMNRISASKLWEIGNILSIPVAWFFEGYSGAGLSLDVEPAANIHAFLATSDAIELGEAFLGLQNDNHRGRILDLMKVMAAAI